MAKESDLLLANQLKKMKKYIEISNETMQAIMNGKRVEGSLGINEWTGKLSFKAYNRQPRLRVKDRVIKQLENGWLKEGARRYKFYNSVKKELGVARVENIMFRELRTAMEELEWEEISKS